MEFPQLGDHCSVSECQELDFLPIKCQHCCQLYCGKHFQPYLHHCQHLPQISQGSDNSSFKHACTYNTCKAKELVAVPCTHCHSNFCLQHRHPPDHNCSSLAPQPPTREDMAREKVQKIADAMPDKPKKRAGHKDPKLAAKVQLMKLKMRCVQCGKSNMLPEESTYFLVVLPLQTSNAVTTVTAVRTIAVCVSSSWSVGKALDAIADLAKISNHNNIGGERVLQLYRHHDGSLLPAQTVITELLATNGLCNGETIVLENMPRGNTTLTDLHKYSVK
uniref:AN1-type zinc finger protein 1-like n=1 Tax=Hirondellea gigas TaxID=1518452 RepID=A0A2P2HX67_9CRUS